MGFEGFNVDCGHGCPLVVNRSTYGATEGYSFCWERCFR